MLQIPRPDQLRTPLEDPYPLPHRPLGPPKVVYESTDTQYRQARPRNEVPMQPKDPLKDLRT